MHNPKEINVTDVIAHIQNTLQLTSSNNQVTHNDISYEIYFFATHPYPSITVTYKGMLIYLIGGKNMVQYNSQEYYWKKWLENYPQLDFFSMIEAL
jgi:hypothetical protein